MKKLFRKAMTVLGSAALLGATIGTAAAASYTDAFASNSAIVVGANAATSDMDAAMSIASAIDAAAAGGAVMALSGGEGETEDEIGLGTIINASGKLTGATLTDSKIPALLDTKISWDDGGPSGADDYNVHEEIILGDIAINTTLDDNDFEQLLAMTNDKALEYRYVFEDAFNVSGVSDSDADTLYLSILGKQYEISGMSASSITVVTSEEVSLSIGESVTVDGVTITVDDVFDGKAQVNGEIISTGNSKKIDGIRVEVDTVGYHSNSPELSKVILKVGEDISKTYSDGEAYIGEDEDDPTWVWTVSSLSSANGYFGVKYNQKETRDNDDVVYSGGAYVFPEDFAQVSFDGTTDVEYEDFKIYFDETEDLWNNTDTTSTAQTLDAPVLVIESVDGTKDAITTTAGEETSKIYLKWADDDEETQGTQTKPSLEVFYSDVDGTVQDAIRPRFSANYTASDDDAAATVASAQIAEIKVGDTIVNVNISVTAGDLQVALTDEGAGQPIYLDIGGVALGNETGDLKWFGGNTESTDKEDGLANDMNVSSTAVGTYDNDIITTNGLIIQTPEANLDNDEVIISVPSDRVYAIVSVTAGGEAADGETGIMTYNDDETSSFANKNVVVVGGSAINAVAAELLEGAYEAADFTAQTGVAAGQFLIETFDRNGKTALLVAGYNAEDTTKAANALVNSDDIDVSEGMKYVSSSTTVSSTDIVTA